MRHCFKNSVIRLTLNSDLSARKWPSQLLAQRGIFPQEFPTESFWGRWTRTEQRNRTGPFYSVVIDAPCIVELLVQLNNTSPTGRTV